MTKQEAIEKIYDAINGEEFAKVEVIRDGIEMHPYYVGDEQVYVGGTWVDPTVENIADALVEVYGEILDVDYKSTVAGDPCAVVEVR